MVYNPGLEPGPGLGLWQALNSGLAQDFQSPSPQSQAQARALSPSQAQYITSDQPCYICSAILSSLDICHHINLTGCTEYPIPGSRGFHQLASSSRDFLLGW